MKFHDNQFHALKEELKVLLNSKIRNKRIYEENCEKGLAVIQQAFKQGLTWEDSFEVKDGLRERLVDVLFKGDVDVEVLRKLSIPKLDMKTPYQQKSKPGQTWFHGAVQKNDLNLFKYLLENQFDGSWVNEKGQNPAFFVTSEKFYKFFKKEMPILFEEVDNNMKLPAEYWIKNDKASNASALALDFDKNNRGFLSVEMICEALVKSIDSNYYKVQDKFKKLLKNYEEDYLNTAIKINGVTLPGIEHNIRNFSKKHEFNTQAIRLYFNYENSLISALDFSKKQSWNSDVKVLWDFYAYAEEFEKNKNHRAQAVSASEVEALDNPEQIARKVIQQMNLVTAVKKTIGRLSSELGLKKEANYSLINMQATLVMVSFVSLSYDSISPSDFRARQSISPFLPRFKPQDSIANLNLWQYPEVVSFVKNNINDKVMNQYVQLNADPISMFYRTIEDKKIKFDIFENALAGLSKVLNSLAGHVPEDNKFRGTKDKGISCNQNELLACLVFSNLDSDVISVIENKKMMKDPQFKKNMEMLIDFEKVLAFGKDYKDYAQYGIGDDFEENKEGKYFKVVDIARSRAETPKMVEDLVFKFELSENIRDVKENEKSSVPKIERF